MRNEGQYTSLEKVKKSKFSKEVYVTAQEVKMVRALASNDHLQRDRQLKKLKKWFALRSISSFSFSNADLMRIWKGLFYCMWMSDKPLIQENLAEDFGKLIGSFSDIATGIQFYGAFLQTMMLEWFGIDQWRMDKYLMLIRKMTRHMFYEMKTSNWSTDCIKLLNSQLNSTILSEHDAEGLILHVSDIFLEELAKVADSSILGHSVAEMIKPFVVFISKQKDPKLMGYIQNRVFYHWLWQSKQGREHNEKFKAWQEMGFPTESIHDIEKIGIDQEEDKGEITNNVFFELDPRAGNIDVYIPELPVNVSPIIQLIEDIMFKDVTNVKSRKILRAILQKYKYFESDGFPLGVNKIPKPKMQPLKPLIEQKVQELENFENELYATSRFLKKLNKKRRKNLLASVDFEQIDEENVDKTLKERATTAEIRRCENAWVEEQIEIPLDVSKTKKRKCDLFENGRKSKKMRTTQKNLGKLNPWAESTTDLKANLDLDESGSALFDSSTELKPTTSWDEPLQDGEIEYFVPHRKNQLKNIANNLHSETQKQTLLSTPVSKIKGKSNQKLLFGKSENVENKKLTFKEKSSQEKRVKIVLHKNMSQKPSDYIQQVRSSPQLPYDSQKMPLKGLLKPNLLPSPINPFYKKKIGLQLERNN